MNIAELRSRYPGYDDTEILGALQATKYPDYSVDEIKQAIGYKPRARSLFAAANDTVIETANAAAGAVGSAADFVSPGNRVSKFIDENIIRAGEASQSDAVKEDKARFRSAVANAEGIGDELGAVGRYIVDAPLQATAQAVGSFVVPGAAIKGARAVAGAAGAGAAGMTRAGLAGGAAAGGALSGGDAAGTAYDLAIRAGATEEQAIEAARGASVIPAAVGAAGGLVGAERIFAGAGGPAGGTLARMLKTGLAEAGQEAIEEGVTQYEGQRAAVPFDSSIDPSKGVAAAAGMGAALGGVTGAGMSLFHGPQAVAAAQSDEALDRLANAGSVDEAIQAFTDTHIPLLPAPATSANKAEGITDVEYVGQTEPSRFGSEQDAVRQREADRPRDPIGQVQPGDILSAQNAPFHGMQAAMGAMARAGEGYELVRVADGLVVRKRTLSEDASFAERVQRMRRESPNIDQGVAIDAGSNGNEEVAARDVQQPGVLGLDEREAEVLQTEPQAVPPVRGPGDNDVPSMGGRLRGVPDRGGQAPEPIAQPGPAGERGQLRAGQRPLADQEGTGEQPLQQRVVDLRGANADADPVGRGNGNDAAGDAAARGPHPSGQGDHATAASRKEPAPTAVISPLPKTAAEIQNWIEARPVDEVVQRLVAASEPEREAALSTLAAKNPTMAQWFREDVQAAMAKAAPAAQPVGQNPVIAGKKIDAEWTAFAPESGTKGMPRAEMPQIKAEHRGAMVNFLNARGIAHEQGEMAAGDLKPTQAEWSPAKVQQAKEFVGGDRSILVSADGHVLDGHHQWLAKLEAGEPVKVIRLDAPIEKLIDEVREFPSAQLSEGAAPTLAERAQAMRTKPMADDLPGLQAQWQEAAKAGDAERARTINDRIVALQAAPKANEQDAQAGSRAAPEVAPQAADAPSPAPATARTEPAGPAVAGPAKVEPAGVKEKPVAKAKPAKFDDETYRVTPDGKGQFTLESDDSIVAGNGDGTPRRFNTEAAAREWAKANGVAVGKADSKPAAKAAPAEEPAAPPTPASLADRAEAMKPSRETIELKKRLSVLNSLLGCLT